MTENLNSRVFSEQLHTAFQVGKEGTAPLTLELSEVTEKSVSPALEQFSLIFKGPLTPQLPQGIFNFKHEKLGTFDLFIVPLGPGPSGMLYEVIFNRMRKPAQPLV